jgi:hypothetical protein
MHLLEKGHFEMDELLGLVAHVQNHGRLEIRRIMVGGQP